MSIELSYLYYKVGMSDILFRRLYAVETNQNQLESKFEVGLNTFWPEPLDETEDYMSATSSILKLGAISLAFQTENSFTLKKTQPCTIPKKVILEVLWSWENQLSKQNRLFWR